MFKIVAHKNQVWLITRDSHYSEKERTNERIEGRKGEGEEGRQEGRKELGRKKEERMKEKFDHFFSVGQIWPYVEIYSYCGDYIIELVSSLMEIKDLFNNSH